MAVGGGFDIQYVVLLANVGVGGVCDIQYVVLLKAGRRVLRIMSPFSNCALIDFIVLVAFVLVGVSRVHLMDNRIATS